MRRDPVSLLDERQPGARFRPGQRKVLQGLLDGRDVVFVHPGGLQTLVLQLLDGELFYVQQARQLVDLDGGFRPESRALARERIRVGAPSLVVPPLATAPVVDEIATRLGVPDALRVVAGIDVPSVALDVARMPHERARHAVLRRCLSEPGALPALVLVDDAVAAHGLAEQLRGGARLRVGEWHERLEQGAREAAVDAFTDGRLDVLVADADPEARSASAWVLGLPPSPEALRELAGRLSSRLVLLVGPRDRARVAARIDALGGSLADLNQLLARLVVAADDEGVFDSGSFDERRRHLLGLAADLGAVEFDLDGGVPTRLRLRSLGRRREDEVAAAARRALRLRWEALSAVTSYTATRGCRRRFLLELFEDPAAPLAEARCCDHCDPPSDLSVLPDDAQPGRARQPRRPPRQQVLHASGPLADALAGWRLERARAEGRSPAAILPDATVDAICERRPDTRVALLELFGMGPRRVARYGDDLLALVADAAL